MNSVEKIALRNLAIFIGIKVAVYIVIFYSTRKLRERTINQSYDLLQHGLK